MQAFSEYTDEQLLELIKTCNEPAFTAAYGGYVEKLFAIAYHFSNRKDIAEEIVQDVFIRLWDRPILSKLPLYLPTSALA